MAAAHLFMKLMSPRKSVIEGESQVEGYEGYIELSDWNWGLSHDKEEKKSDKKTGKAEPSKSSKAEPSVFSFSKPLDRSTTALLTCLRTGQVLPSAEITLEEGSEAEFELTVTLADLRVLEYAVEIQMDDTRGTLEESWVVNYHSIQFDYKPSKTLPPNERGLLQVTMKRPPGASCAAVASGGSVEAEIMDILDKLPDNARKPLWARVEKALNEPRKAAPEAAGGKKKGAK